MNNFLKELIKLATELNQVNEFDAVVVINEMEILYDNHVAELNNLGIPHVRLSLPDRKLFNKFKHKEYGGLDLAYRLLEEGFITLECYEEMKDGVRKYLSRNEA